MSISSSNLNSKLLFTVIFSILTVIFAILIPTLNFNLTIKDTTTTTTATAITDNKELKMTAVSRSIYKTIFAREVPEGAGAVVRRSIGVMTMRNFSPFLMLDHFKVSPEAGFPDHPHRGQETITYLLKGQMAHEDFTGSAGVLSPGDLQFMTAGRGVVHAEMPVKSEDRKAVEGMQLWVDLPIELKECEPRYRDLKAKEIPIVKPNDKVTVKVISGTSYGTESVKDLAYTPVVYYYYNVKPGGSFEQEVPKDFNVFLYLMKGDLEITGKQIPQFTNVFFNQDGDVITGKVAENATDDTEFVLIGGKKLDQPIVQHGPFVETSRERIMKAFMDYQSFSNGFERALGWASKIGRGH